LILDRTESGRTDFSNAFAKSHTAPILISKIEGVLIYLDRSSIEVFINEGELVMTDIIFPTEPYNQVRLTGFENDNTLHYLSSIW
jgi:fructan beta-fructosidase